MTIVRGQSSIGMSNKSAPSPYLPSLVISPDAHLAYLSEKLKNLTTLVEGKADAGKLKTLIAMSDEAILIQARNIALVGEITIAAVINEQNGTTTGTLPSKVTRIVGPMIQTGLLASGNLSTTEGSYFDLDNGVLVMGGTADPKFLFEDGDLTISGNLTANSVVLTTGLTLGDIAALSADAIDATDLQAILDAGVDNLIAGMGGDYSLQVTETAVIAKHNLANPSGLGAGYAGTLRTGLVITAAGLGMGYNDKTTGAWVNSMLLDATGSAAFKGTILATSIIAGSVTVDGVAISTVKSQASTASTHAAASGNPHSTTLAAVGGDLDDIADGSSYFKSTATQNTGATRAANALDSSSDYKRALSTQSIVVSGSNPLNGLVIDSAGLRAYAAGTSTFSIDALTGAAFFGGNVSTNGYLFAAGTYAAPTGYTAAIQASPTSSSQRAVVGHSSGSGVGATGITTTGIGVQAVGLASTGVALQALAYSASDIALEVHTGYMKKNRSVGGVLEVFLTGGGASQGIFEFEMRLNP